MMHCKAHPEVNAIFNVSLKSDIKFDSRLILPLMIADSGISTNSEAKIQNELL